MQIRQLGIQSYQSVWTSMKQFTIQRQPNTEDELWILEHFPVYTQGQAGKTHHLLNTGHIPVIQSDRGGQVTYHGPGQLIAYVLMDLRQRHLGIRTLVCQLEQVLIHTLQTYQIDAHRQPNAPGVYVTDKKIASIGLRVKTHYTYHGIALNVDCDLNPFQGINPCGYEQLKMTNIKEYANISFDQVCRDFIKYFLIMFEHDHA